MKKRVVFIVLIFLFIINLTAVATFSYNRWLKPKTDIAEESPQEIWESIQEQVALDPPQLETMKNQRLSFEKEILSLRMEIWQKRRVLIEEIRNPDPDLSRIDKAIDELSRLQVEIQKKTIRNILKDKEILSPWQQRRYFSLFERHLQQPGRGWGKGGWGWRGHGLGNYN
ncbi:MAG: periplasmic heavy metal sensor [Candidatus Aminicenantes bacterium]|nr:periplasmic heavy metal sensor [Candidatus Aminicenantes bacterium]